MSARYRPAAAEDRPTIERIMRLCFGLEPQRAARSIDRTSLAETRLLLDAGGRVTASVYLVPMGIFLGGRSVSNLGIAGVGVLPEHRGKGCSTEMMTAVLKEGRDRGFAVSTLHPATQTVYRRVGYEYFGGYYEIRMPMATIGAVASSDVEVSAYQGAERSTVLALQKAYARQFDGHLDRGPYVWEGSFLHRGQETIGYLFREAGQITGYCFLLNRPATGHRYDVFLADAVATTPGTSRAMLRFLAGHRSLGRDVVWHGTPADPLLAEVAEDRYDITLRHRVMMRVLDPIAALTARGYRRHCSGRLSFAMEDPIFGRTSFTMELAEGRATATPGGEGALRCDVTGFAALLGQLQPATRLRALGWLDGDDAAIEMADALFAGPQSALTEMF